MHGFIPYTGKIQPIEDENVPDLKASANTVLHLAENIESHKNHTLHFDHWFTGIPQHLAERGIWCCGTVRVPRLPGIPNNQHADKN